MKNLHDRALTNRNRCDFQTFYIRPRLAVVLAQWNWGISDLCITYHGFPFLAKYHILIHSLHVQILRLFLESLLLSKSKQVYN